MASALLLRSVMLYDHDDWFSECDDSRGDFEIEEVTPDTVALTYVDEGTVHRVLLAVGSVAPVRH